MTKLDLRSITSMVGHRCFAGGMELYRAGNVRLDSRKSRLFSDWISIRGSADGYSCNANLFGNGRMQCYCECSDWQRAYACARVVSSEMPGWLN